MESLGGECPHQQDQVQESFGRVFRREQDRVREIFTLHKASDDPGKAFLAIKLEALLRRTERAVMEQNQATMLRLYQELCAVQ